MRYRPALSLLPLVFGALGCRSGHTEMPLEPGRKWTYAVRTPLLRYVSSLEVGSSSAEGIELRGPMGHSVLRWEGDVLRAVELSGTTFDPPIPLLVAGEAKASRSWKGRVQGPYPVTSATAVLTQSEVELPLPARKLRTTFSRLRMECGRTVVELESWFARGEGLVRQEQRVNGAFTVGLEKLRG